MAENPNKLPWDEVDKLGEIYKIEFVKSLDRKLTCPICKFVLRSPFQTECGHRYCEGCIKNIIDNGDKRCPEESTEVTKLSHRQIFRDRHCSREISSLQCFCINKNLGCEWTGLFKEIENHCNTTCTKVPLDCVKGCGEGVPRSEMENHLRHDCPKAESACPLVGQCDFQGSRADIKKHMSEKQVEHMAMVTDRMSSIETNLRQTQNSIQQHEVAVDNQTKNYREELASLRDDLATLRAAVDRQPNRSHEVEESARPLPAGEPQGAGKPDADEMKDLKTRLERLEDQVKQLLVSERQALGRGQIGGQTGDNANETVSDLERRVAAMEHQNTLSEVEMADHDLKINMLETTSYDGIFFWKIDDFGRRLQDAVAGRCLSIYSPQFYVGRYGYKVCCRVYLNGDGMGKGTHLSLFFVVMRGAYDALLPWPFQQKVSFKLIDQTGDQHIINSFRPDPNSSSFQRPTSNMNIASGCPLFVPKSVLHSRGYIRDEKVFFKITVDTTGLPIR